MSRRSSLRMTGRPPVRRLAATLAAVLFGPIGVFLLVRPSVVTAAVLHGTMFGLLVIVALTAIGSRGRARYAAIGGTIVGGLYFAATSIPFVSDVVIPILPTEAAFHTLSADVSPQWGPDSAYSRLSRSDVTSDHWSLSNSDQWSSYKYRGPFAESKAARINSRQAAFHRIGHDLVALGLGLVAAFVGSLYREPDPNDRPRQPAAESKEVVRRLMSHGR